MSLFRSDKNMSKWEKKYFSLLDDHDAEVKSYQENEALLCKTITRLSLAAGGLSSELDPYLLRIRNQLKNGLDRDALKQELEEFSNALMSFEEPSEVADNQDPRLLIEFLARQYPRRESDLERIYRRFLDPHHFNLQDLLLALHELIDEEHSVVSEIHQLNVDDTAIRVQLMHLLESTEIPERFLEQSEQLKLRLQNHGEALTALLDGVFTLLLSIKQQFQSEQRAMAQFLGNLTEQLGDIEQHTGAMTGTDEQPSREKKNLLDQSVAAQIHELHRASSQATQLEPLKQLIGNRLDQIVSQIQAQQQQEQLEHNRQRLSLQQLGLKIQRLESASNQIKRKLDRARDKAFHDPLTGLPNRLAFDEKLELEMQRRRRHGSALSLAVWDIDSIANINASFGEKAGDNTVKIIGRLLAQNGRGLDFLSRFGGDEFILLLPETNARSALTIADNLRRRIANTGFNSNGKKIAISISCGITEFTNEDDGESAFKRAKEALRRAKNDGRNRCIIG